MQRGSGICRRLAGLLLLVVLGFFVCSRAEAGVESGADVADLTDLSGRFTLGPWSGTWRADECTLTNDEPLAGASLVLSGRKGQAPDGFTATVGGRPVIVDTARFAHADFFTDGPHLFDLHGAQQALSLFTACLAGKPAPTPLPDQPLQESAPHPVADTSWQITTLTTPDGYVYARYAFPAPPAASPASPTHPAALGVWAYGPERVFLALSSLPKAGAPAGSPSPDAVLTLEGTPPLRLPVFAQEAGFLIPLTDEDVARIETSRTIRIQRGPVDHTYDLTGFTAVRQALTLGRSAGNVANTGASHD